MSETINELANTIVGSENRPTSKHIPESNFIGQLLEYCAKMKLPPASFEMIEDATNSQEFCVKCTVSNVEMVGTDPNIEQAMQTAAIKVLETLRLGQSRREDDSQVDGPVMKVAKRQLATQFPCNNFTGQLFEYCTKNRLPPASFVLVERTQNSLGQSEFCMKCTVNNIEKRGTGSKIKVSKQTAAKMVLEELRIEESTQKNDSQADENETCKNSGEAVLPLQNRDDE